MKEPTPPPTVSTRSKATLILRLAILSLALVPVNCGILAAYIGSLVRAEVVGIVEVFLVPAGLVLGSVTWYLSIRELRRIRTGEVPASSTRTVQRGETIGMFGTFVNPMLSIFVGIIALFSSSSISSPRDAMINDLNSLWAASYQYRIRPASMQGGEGSYQGYSIDARRAKNANGSYSAVVIHPDTIEFRAVWAQDPTSTMTVRIDGEGRAIPESWKYTGDFN